MTIQYYKELTTPMLITNLGQHLVILDKLWMKKHGVILDIRNDQLTFWPSHCQHVTTKAYAAELHAAEPHDTPIKTILKQPANAQLKPLPHFFSSTLRVSKVPSNVLKAVIPQQKIPKSVKPKKKKKSRRKKTNKETNKKPSVDQFNQQLFDLAFIGAVPFLQLAKLNSKK